MCSERYSPIYINVMRRGSKQTNKQNNQTYNNILQRTKRTESVKVLPANQPKQKAAPPLSTCRKATPLANEKKKQPKEKEKQSKPTVSAQPKQTYEMNENQTPTRFLLSSYQHVVFILSLLL